MELKDVMSLRSFTVLGSTQKEGKTAKEIKDKLIENGYYCIGVPENKSSLNEEQTDVLDLCMNPSLSIEYLKSTKTKYKIIVIQPGAASQEVINFLQETNQKYIEACLLVGMKLYKK